jgi:hypothetical protein
MNPKVSGFLRIRAAEAILARAWGPPAPIEHSDEGNKGEMLADFSKLTNEEWEQFKKLNHKVVIQKDEDNPVPFPSREQKIYG